jgi:hypothetical protein
MGEAKKVIDIPHGPIPSEDGTHYRRGHIGTSGGDAWSFTNTKPNCEKCPNCPGCPDQYSEYQL